MLTTHQMVHQLFQHQRTRAGADLAREIGQRLDDLEKTVYAQAEEISRLTKAMKSREEHTHEQTLA